MARASRSTTRAAISRMSQAIAASALRDTLLLVPDPMIVVEVLSPSTERLDKAGKLADYFSIPSIAHYLIVDLKRRHVIHHSRGEGGIILTRIVREGDIVLDPPGIAIAMADTFGD